MSYYILDTQDIHRISDTDQSSKQASAGCRRPRRPRPRTSEQFSNVPKEGGDKDRPVPVADITIQESFQLFQKTDEIFKLMISIRHHVDDNVLLATL